MAISLASLKPLATMQQSSQPTCGIWLATVSRLDRPPVSLANINNPASQVHVQQQAMINKLDHLQHLSINTVFFQVKPDGTAPWSSEILLWSSFTTGKIGENSGYDPLQFILGEVHRRGTKVHAWFNPYRVSVNTKSSTVRGLSNALSQRPTSIYVQHCDWVRAFGDHSVLDPGIPEIQDWITLIIVEVISHYPVDGAQLDDYSYTGSSGSRLNDSETYCEYEGTFASKTDWWRNNTQQLIARVSHIIKSIKPGVEFSVNPAGVWCNRLYDSLGPDTQGAAACDESYADTRQWAERGLLGYIAPQIYWPSSRSATYYDMLTEQWADVVKPIRTCLHIGTTFYKAGEPSKVGPDQMINGGVPELKEQLDPNDIVPKINGTALSREDYLNKPQTQ